MNVADTRAVHERAGNWTVDLICDDGEAVSVRVTDDALTDEEKVIENAKQIMSELAN